MVNQIFNKQIEKNMHVNDMLIMSKEEEDHLDDLRETFNMLR